MAYLSYGFGLDGLGIGKYGWYLVEELRKMNIDVDVYTTNFLHHKGFGAPAFFFKNAFLFLKNYDVVHSNEGAGILVYHPNLVETYHHDYKKLNDINNLVFSLIESLNLRKIKHVIVPSSKTKKSLLENGFSNKDITIIHHGVDQELFKLKESSRQSIRKKYNLENSFVVISVGRLVNHKRHKDIIKVLNQIPNCTFVLVGDGEEADNIIKFAKTSKVHLLRFKNITEEFLADLYNASDVYVHSSVLEGFGLTILEAMACSLPIICYDVADLKQIVDDAGITLEVNNFEGMREAILRLKNNKELLDQYRKAALNKSKKFTWRISAEEHLKVYRKVLEKNNGI